LSVGVARREARQKKKELSYRRGRENPGVADVETTKETHTAKRVEQPKPLAQNN
jgi:hypothetical protein